MYKLTGKPYRPKASHNIASWNAIVRCMYVNGGKATRQQLEAAIPQRHPLPVKGDYSGNVVKHIDWHIENNRLVQGSENIPNKFFSQRSLRTLR